MFFLKNEKILIKSLLYGFVGGFFYGILFTPTTKIVPNGNSNLYEETTPLHYTIDILQASVIASLITLLITIIFIFTKKK